MKTFEDQLRSEGVDVVSGVTNVMETLSKRNRYSQQIAIAMQSALFSWANNL